ncbi:MAG: glycosyltransferase, partial [Kangiellaceae bacterium]|nr:glycosyltransferase [Kangiellaceae bacterium]
RLSIALQQQGHQIEVFHLGNEYIVNACREKNIEERVVPNLDQYKSLITVFMFSVKFARYLKQQGFDVLHTHLYGPITGSFLGTGLFSLKHIGTLHDVYSVKERVGRGFILRLAQLFGTKLVSVSDDMKSFYESYIPMARTIKNVHNGIDITCNSKDLSDPLSSFDDGQKIRIVTVGRMIPLKRQNQQLEAMAELLRNTPISLYFVGDGPDLEKISRKIKALNLEECVFALGNRNDVADILEHSDIFVLASESEGLSCSIIEAMGAGLPCVVSDVGGNSELIESSVNGFTFERDNFDQFAEKLQVLIDSSKLRLEMGQASKDKAKAAFSIDSMLHDYQLLYQ